MGSQLVLCGQYFINNLYLTANLSNPVNSQPNWLYAAILKYFKYHLYRKNGQESCNITMRFTYIVNLTEAINTTICASSCFIISSM